MTLGEFRKQTAGLSDDLEFIIENQDEPEMAHAIVEVYAGTEFLCLEVEYDSLLLNPAFEEDIEDEC